MQSLHAHLPSFHCNCAQNKTRTAGERAKADKAGESCRSGGTNPLSLTLTPILTLILTAGERAKTDKAEKAAAAKAAKEASKAADRAAEVAKKAAAAAEKTPEVIALEAEIDAQATVVKALKTAAEKDGAAIQVGVITLASVNRCLPRLFLRNTHSL
jgi:hypothetical protein